MGSSWDDRSNKRIARSVRKSEGDGGNNPRGGQRWFGSPYGFWGEITDRVDVKYSWTAIEPRDDHKMTKNDDWRTGDANDPDGGYAVENWNSESVPNGEQVWLEPSRNQKYFLFFYSGLKHGILKSTITARSGDTPGKGRVEFKKFDKDTETLSVGEEYDVYNFYQSEITFDSSADDVGLQVVFDNGVWWTGGQDCVI